MTKYRLIKLAFQILFKFIAKIKITGAENFPPSGSYILAINHLTILDPVILLAVLPIKHATVFVAKKWEHHFFVGPLVRGLGGIFVQRGEVDRAALLASLRVLKSGDVLGIAPEGTRSPTGGLQRAKPGVAYLATKAGVPVLPVGVSGHSDFMKTLRRLRRLRIHVQVGKLISLQPVSGKGKTEQLQAYADQIMIALSKLVDPELRGIYASAVPSSHK